MIEFKQIKDENIYSYLFSKEGEISLFLSESFNIDKLYTSLKKDMFNNVKQVLNNEGLIKKGRKEIISLHENGYVYNFLKIINGITVKISVIPKIIKLFNSKDVIESDIDNINKILFNFDEILKKFNSHTKKSKIFNKKIGSFNMIEFETDLRILKNLLYIIKNNRVHFDKKNKHILSDILIGEINIEVCQYINEKNILPQIHKSREEAKIKAIIFNTIALKYNKNFLLFLKQNNTNNIIGSLISTINQIMSNQFFLNRDLSQITPPQLKSLIKKEIAKKNQNEDIFLDLLILLENNINYDSKSNIIKKVIRLEKIWEQFNENYFKKKYEKISFQGAKSISEFNKNENYFNSSDSKIDIIWELCCNINGKMLSYFDVVDCKYKVLDNDGNPLPSDIDKIKRDSDIHNKLNHKEQIKLINLDEKLKLLEKISSYLIYPKHIEIDISTFKDKKIVINNKANYYYKQEKIDFSKNLEYQNVNIFKAEVEFLLIENIDG